MPRVWRGPAQSQAFVLQSFSTIFFADSGVCGVTPTRPRQIFSAAFLRSPTLEPSTAVEQRPARVARALPESAVCVSTLDLHSSTTAERSRLVGFGWVVLVIFTSCEELVAAEEEVVAADVAVVLATAAAAVVTVTTVVVAELCAVFDDDDPQPARPTSAITAAVNHLEGMRLTGLLAL